MDNYAHLALAHRATQLPRMDLTAKPGEVAELRKQPEVSLDVSPNDFSPANEKRRLRKSPLFSA